MHKIWNWSQNDQIIKVPINILSQRTWCRSTLSLKNLEFQNLVILNFILNIQ